MGTPKGEQAPLFSSPFGRGVAAPALKPGFSFDWKRGRDKTKEQALGALGNLSSWGGVGDTAPFTSRQRWKHFVGLLMLSGFFFVLAGAFLPLVLLRPQKFCLFFTMGSILNMASFAVLRGPVEQLKHMFSLQRLPFTSAYLGSMVLTLWAALVVQSYVMVVLFALLQGAALAWYLLSYIPGGAPVLKLVTKAMARLCCRCGAGGGSLLPI